MRIFMYLLLALLPAWAAPTANDSYTASIESWRAQRLARLRDPQGWLSLAGLFWLKPGANTVGQAPDNDIVFPQGPEHLGVVHSQGSTVEQSLKGMPSTQVSLSEKEGSTTFRLGSLSWHFLRRSERVGLRLKDSQSPTLLNFPGLDFFPIAPEWAVPAQFEPHPAGPPLAVPNVQGFVTPMTNPGRVLFELQGQPCALEVLQGEGEKDFVLLFSDETSNHESYAGGRFLTLEPPAADGTVLLDFNKAYNPPCCFTHYATCLLPLTANHLKVAVRAGEKFAGH